MKYKEQLIKSMEFLSEDPNVIFLGQSVSYTGNAIYNTLSTIPNNRKIEMPVFAKRLQKKRTSLYYESG